MRCNLFSITIQSDNWQDNSDSYIITGKGPERLTIWQYMHTAKQ